MSTAGMPRGLTPDVASRDGVTREDLWIAVGRFPSRLYCRQEQGYQDANNCNDDQQFDKRERRFS